jgi:predicted dehydrogenase
LQVNGEKGWACLSPAFQYDLERRLSGEIGGHWFERKFKVIDELAREIDALADSVRRRREPEPNGVEGMRDVAVMEAIYQSAREGRTVPITMPE